MNWTPAIIGSSLALLLATAAIGAETAPGAVAFTDSAVSASLTGVAGDPVNGAAVYKDRGLGNCLACHANKAMESELFHGNVGPPIDGIAGRYSPEQLRAIVVNAKKVFGPETIMPGFYTLEVGVNVRDSLVGKTVLTSQQVEDVVAYLMTLK